MNKKLMVIALLILIVVTGIMVYAFRNRTIGNNGVVKTYGLNVYWDSNCITEVTNFDWGFVDSGELYNFTVYIRNEGNQPLNLSLSTYDWNSIEAETFINQTWSCEGYILNEDETIDTLVVLTIDGNIENVTSFSFTTLISG